MKIFLPTVFLCALAQAAYFPQRDAVAGRIDQLTPEKKPEPALKLEISDVRGEQVVKSDLELAPDAVASWTVTSRLKNTSNQTFIILAPAFYGGSVRTQMEPNSFVGGSRLPLKNTADFVILRPGDTVTALHAVYAMRTSDGKFVIRGFFYQCVESKYRVDYPAIWSLEETPVAKEFNFSITLKGRLYSEAKPILGVGFKQLWVGDVVSDSVNMKIGEE